MRNSSVLIFLFTILVISLSLSRLKGADGALTHNFTQTPKAVIYGDHNDEYPEKIFVKGKVKQVTLTRGYCGLVWNYGTMEVEVLDSPKGYTGKFIYLVIPCLFDPNGEGAYLGKDICFLATKLTKTDHPNSGIFNTIDSGGVPFYYVGLSARGAKDFFERAECHSDKESSLRSMLQEKF